MELEKKELFPMRIFVLRLFIVAWFSMMVIVLVATPSSATDVSRSTDGNR